MLDFEFGETKLCVSSSIYKRIQPEVHMNSCLKVFTLTLCFMMLLNACAPAATPMSIEKTPDLDAPIQSGDTSSKGEVKQAEWLPRLGDELLSRDAVYLDEVSILTLESFPLQHKLFIKGSLPTPCHKLRVNVPQPDEEGQVQVEVYALSQPGEICIQVLKPFEVYVSLPQPLAGALKIWVNGDYIGEILP